MMWVAFPSVSHPHWWAIRDGWAGKHRLVADTASTTSLCEARHPPRQKGICMNPTAKVHPTAEEPFEVKSLPRKIGQTTERDSRLDEGPRQPVRPQFEVPKSCTTLPRNSNSREAGSTAGRRTGCKKKIASQKPTWSCTLQNTSTQKVPISSGDRQVHAGEQAPQHASHADVRLYLECNGLRPWSLVPGPGSPGLQVNECLMISGPARQDRCAV